MRMYARHFEKTCFSFSTTFLVLQSYINLLDQQTFSMPYFTLKLLKNLFFIEYVKYYTTLLTILKMTIKNKLNA